MSRVRSAARDVLPDSADALQLRYNIDQQDLYNVLDAQATFWRSGSAQALGTDPAFWTADSTYLAARIRSYPANVSITNPLEEVTELCQVGGGQAVEGPSVRVLPEDEGARATARLSARVDQRSLERTVLVLDTSGSVGRARVRVFDVRGRLVAEPFDEDEVEAGHHEIAWNRRDLAGMPVASGVYFVRLETAVGSSTGKVVVVR